MLKDTRDCLYLSFQQLPLHLRRCFAFCSLYSKGYLFRANDKYHKFEYSENLVHLWIAQGFVEAPESNEITLEEKGMQYFNELVSYSFFQKIDSAYGDKYVKYVIHDLLHDLAEKVSTEHCFRIESRGPITIPKTTMHLSIGRYQPPSISSILSQIFELPNLRTFLVLSSIIEEELGDKFIHKVFEKLKKLRVLYFKGFKVTSGELPKSIGKLKYLRYFRLRGVKKLHESLGGLYHVQYLYLGEYTIIDEVPESLNNLINLRYFEPAKMLTSIPCLGKLSHLQHCEYSIANSRNQQGINQFKHLQKLQQLELNNLENVKNKGDASEASLKEKNFLVKLNIGWKNWPDRDGWNDEEVAERLVPPPNLSSLQIDGYNGLCFPKWLLYDQQFSHLSELSIISCSKVKQLLTLPTTLKRLKIFGCENLCEVSRLSPNLEYLRIERSPGFEAMLFNILLFDVDHEEKEEEHQLQPFRLQELLIDDCSSMGEKRFIFDPKAALFTSLSELYLCNLPWLTSVHLEHNLTSLVCVTLESCENLELFRRSLASTTSSRMSLYIEKCPMLATKQREAAATAIKEWCFEVLNIDDPSLLAALVSSTSGNCLSSLKGLCFREAVAILFSLKEENLLQRLTFPSLEWLSFIDCYDLPSLPLSLHKQSSLQHLSIKNCPKIESLHYNLPASLESVTIIPANPELKRNYGKGGPLYHEISQIPNVLIC